MTARPQKPRHRLRYAILALALALIAFRLYLPTLVKNYVNEQLNRDPHFRGGVADVRLHILRGAYTLVGLDLERVETQSKLPIVSAREIEIGLNWGALLRRTILAQIFVRGLVLNLTEEPAPEKKADAGRTWEDVFKKLVPLDVEKLEIAGDSVHFRDLAARPQFDISLDQLEVSGSNLTNSHRLSSSLFGTVDLHARAMKSGRLHLEMAINPIETPAEFKISTELRDLDLTDLNAFFTAYGKFDVKSGKFSAYSEMATARGRLDGYVKPIITELSVADFREDRKKGTLHAFWEVLVGAVLGVFKNHPKQQQAAIVPFTGRLDDPKTSGWEIFKSVLHNVFVAPISPEIDHSVSIDKLRGKR